MNLNLFAMTAGTFQEQKLASPVKSELNDSNDLTHVNHEIYLAAAAELIISQNLTLVA